MAVRLGGIIANQDITALFEPMRDGAAVSSIATFVLDLASERHVTLDAEQRHEANGQNRLPPRRGRALAEFVQQLGDWEASCGII